MAKILIVGDNIGQIDLIATTIEGLGYEVVTVYESMDAMDVAMEESFDLVILEANMGGINGYELADTLRGDPSIESEMPIVMIDSGFLDKDRILSTRITETMLPELDSGLMNEILVRLTCE